MKMSLKICKIRLIEWVNFQYSIIQFQQNIESENISLKKVRQAHLKAVRELDGDSQIGKRHDKIMENLNDAKAEFREKTELFKNENKMLQQEHQQIIDMEEKWRKLAQLIRAHNRGESTVGNSEKQTINENDIDTLTRQIENLEDTKKIEEVKYK